MIALQAFLRLLREAPGGPTLILFALMVLAGMSQGVGILLLVPLLQILQDHVAGQNGWVQSMVHGLNILGFPSSAGGLLLAFLLLVAFSSGVQYGREQLGAKLQYQLVDQLRKRCFSALLGAEWRWIAAGRLSDHANLLLTDVSRVGVGLNYGLNLLASIATMLAYLLAAFALSWTMTSLALISGTLVMFALSGQRSEAMRLGQKLGSSNRTLHGNVQESLAGIKLTKILGNERRHLDHFLETTGRLRQEQLRFMASTNQARALFQVGGATLLAFYLYVGLIVWHTPVPELLTLVLVFGRLIPMFAQAQQQFHQWLHALPALQETDGLLAECALAAEPQSQDRTPWAVNEEICVEDVTIRYPDRDSCALACVSARFPARTTTAIIGASGAGKSTLADVLMGLLAPDEGELRIDGVLVAGAARMRWRHSVAYVPQEVFLFNDTIRSNLLWGCTDALEADLVMALQRAAAEFVFSLPQGLDTLVGDVGVRLSGGERQRLALARALLRRPALLLLDEATSALDTENEAKVRAAIEHLHGDLTVILIGHRLPTLEHADQVLVMEAGRITTQGSWDEVRKES